MAQSAIELLKSYRSIIEAAEEEDNSINSEPEMDNEIAPEPPNENELNDSDDPIHELSSEIASAISGDSEKIYSTIESFLRKNKYEITSVDGITSNGLF